MTAWVFLKRAVSPESFKSFRFNEQMLRNVESLLGLRDEHKTTAPDNSVHQPSLAKQLAEARRLRTEKKGAKAKAANLPKAKPEKRGIRLLLELQGNHLFGGVYQGNERVYGWNWLPGDLRRFMAQHYYFEPTRKFFKEFTALEGGYPITFRQKNAKETVLEYRDKAHKAGVTFSLDGDEVRVTRCFADGSSLPAKTVIVGECLINFTDTTIQPISDLEPWKVWNAVFDGLEEQYELTGQSFTHSGDTLTVSTLAFNAIGLRLSPILMKKFSQSFRFIAADGVAVDPNVAHSPNYLLMIENNLGEEIINLTPHSEMAGVRISLSPDTFRLFLPGFRAGLPQPLRAKNV